MKVFNANQLTFSSLIFDTFFGLILFFSIEAFLDIKNPWHLVYYIFSIFIVAHWWLVFKSADDIYADEVTDSAADLIFGIVDIVFLNYIVLLARSFQYLEVTYFMIALLVADLIWATIWRFVGTWDTKNKIRIANMENDLQKKMMLDTIFIALLSFVAILGPHFTTNLYVLVFISVYLCYIALTFIWKIISIHIF